MLLARWNRIIGLAVAATRKHAGLTQEQLAEKMRWHRSKVVKIEGGVLSMRVADLISMAKTIQVEPGDIVRRVVNW